MPSEDVGREPRLPAVLTWALKVAVELAKDDESAGRLLPTTIEQRMVIGLLQARAQECRNAAGQLHMQGATRENPIALRLAMWLTGRSEKIEQMGLSLAENWPPTAENFKDKAWVRLE